MNNLSKVRVWKTSIITMIILQKNSRESHQTRRKRETMIGKGINNLITSKMHLENSMKAILPLHSQLPSYQLRRAQEVRTKAESTSYQIKSKSRTEANSIALISTIPFTATELGIFGQNKKLQELAFKISKHTTRTNTTETTLSSSVFKLTHHMIGKKPTHL